MKRLLALIILAVLGFYIVWPAWSGYRMVAALQSGDTGLLEAKIDFPSIRQSLRPVVEGEVNKELDKQMGQGLGAVIGGDIKKQMAPKLTDMVLEKVVTAENVVRIAREGGNVAGSVQKIMMEQLSKSGGLPGMPSLPGAGSGSGGTGGLGGILGAAGAAGAGGRLPGGLNIPGFGGGGAAPQPAPPAQAPATQPAQGTIAARPGYGLGNIKSFGWSPLAYRLGVARDPAAAKPDATVTMSFTGFDWKITGLVPNL